MLKDSRFVLSPRGAGEDCYRTWEALYLGCIPVVKSSAIDAVFQDLPVLIVDDWKSINECFLRNHLEKINKKVEKNKFYKLHIDYWKNLFSFYKKKIREKT